jgi:hypothetical protein
VVLLREDDRETGRGGGVLYKDAGGRRSVEATIAVALEVAIVEGVAAVGRPVAAALVRATGQRKQEEKRQ